MSTQGKKKKNQIPSLIKNLSVWVNDLKKKEVDVTDYISNELYDKNGNFKKSSPTINLTNFYNEEFKKGFSSEDYLNITPNNALLNLQNNPSIENYFEDKDTFDNVFKRFMNGTSGSKFEGIISAKLNQYFSKSSFKKYLIVPLLGGSPRLFKKDWAESIFGSNNYQKINSYDLEKIEDILKGRSLTNAEFNNDLKLKILLQLFFLIGSIIDVKKQAVVNVNEKEKQGGDYRLNVDAPQFEFLDSYEDIETKNDIVNKLLTALVNNEIENNAELKDKASPQGQKPFVLPVTPSPLQPGDQGLEDDSSLLGSQDPLRIKSTGTEPTDLNELGTTRQACLELIDEIDNYTSDEFRRYLEAFEGSEWEKLNEKIGFVNEYKKMLEESKGKVEYNGKTYMVGKIPRKIDFTKFNNLSLDVFEDYNKSSGTFRPLYDYTDLESLRDKVNNEQQLKKLKEYKADYEKKIDEFKILEINKKDSDIYKKIQIYDGKNSHQKVMSDLIDNYIKIFDFYEKVEESYSAFLKDVYYLVFKEENKNYLQDIETGNSSYENSQLPLEWLYDQYNLLMEMIKILKTDDELKKEFESIVKFGENETKYNSFKDLVKTMKEEYVATEDLFNNDKEFSSEQMTQKLDTINELGNNSPVFTKKEYEDISGVDDIIKLNRELKVVFEDFDNYFKKSFPPPPPLEPRIKSITSKSKEKMKNEMERISKMLTEPLTPIPEPGGNSRPTSKDSDPNILKNKLGVLEIVNLNVDNLMTSIHEANLGAIEDFNDCMTRILKLYKNNTSPDDKNATEIEKYYENMKVTVQKLAETNTLFYSLNNDLKNSKLKELQEKLDKISSDDQNIGIEVSVGIKQMYRYFNYIYNFDYDYDKDNKKKIYLINFSKKLEDMVVRAMQIVQYYDPNDLEFLGKIYENATDRIPKRNLQNEKGKLLNIQDIIEDLIPSVYTKEEIYNKEEIRDFVERNGAMIPISSPKNGEFSTLYSELSFLFPEVLPEEDDSDQIFRKNQEFYSKEKT